MARTRRRPLVTGVISHQQATAARWATAGMGSGILALTTTPTTAVLGLSTIYLYTHIYTPMKRVTRFNTEVGALVGAIPPVMGWTAALGSSGVMTWEAVFLAGTLYSWQMHHFMTIAWSRRVDYEKGGFVMQSLNDPTGISTATKGLAWAVGMLPLPFLATAMNITNPMFMVTGSLINAYLLRVYWRFYQNRTSQMARKALIAGLIQLIGFFAGLGFHLQERDQIRGFDWYFELRQQGKEKCLYHYHTMSDEYGHWCMWLFGGEKKSTSATLLISSGTADADADCSIHPIAVERVPE